MPSSERQGDPNDVNTAKRHQAEDLDLWNRLRKVAANRLDEMSKNSNDQVPYQMGEKEKEMIQQLHVMGVKEGILAGVCTMILLRRGPIILSRYLYKRQMQQRGSGGGGGMRGPQMGQQQSPPPPPPPSSGSTYQLSKPPNPPPQSGSSSNPFQRAAGQSHSQQAGGSGSVPPPPSSYYEWQNPRPQSFTMRTVWFCVDLSVSLLAAASISMAYTDTNKIQRQLEELPLIPGRSLVSEAFCDTLELELNKIHQEHHPSYERLLERRKRHDNNNSSMTTTTNFSDEMQIHNNNNNAKQQQQQLSQYLESVLVFVEHCQRRRAVEQDIRLQRGNWNKREVIEIPHPGIPRDGQRMTLASLLQEGGDGSTTTKINDNDESHNNVNSGHDDDGDWYEMDSKGSSSSTSSNHDDELLHDADRFVMDQDEQEEEDNSKKEQEKKKPKRGWW